MSDNFKLTIKKDVAISDIVPPAKPLKPSIILIELVTPQIANAEKNNQLNKNSKSYQNNQNQDLLLKNLSK